MPAQEREDAGHFLREGVAGCSSRGRRLLFIVVGGKNNEFLPGETQNSTMLEFQIQWTCTNCSLQLEVVHMAFKVSILEKDEVFQKFLA